VVKVPLWNEGQGKKETTNRFRKDARIKGGGGFYCLLRQGRGRGSREEGDYVEEREGKGEKLRENLL